MNISQVLKTFHKNFKNNKIPNSQLEAEILLSDVLKKPREFLLAHPEFEVSKAQAASYELRVARRLKGEPIAYIMGHKEFYGLNFFVDKNVLIPRPETELMIDEIMEHRTRNMKHATFIDVGTGSGCIIITLAKLLKNNIQFLATDISKPTLLIARKNAKLHQVDKQIKFFRGNLMEPVIQNPKYLKCLNNPNYPIIITANLPYLTPAQIKNSPTIQYEPKLALSAGPDGLKYYRKLFKQIKHLYFLPNFSSGLGGFSRPARLKPREPALKRGRIIVLCEIDPSQVKKIKQLIKKELFKVKIQIKKDLSGRDRLIICSFF